MNMAEISVSYSTNSKNSKLKMQKSRLKKLQSALSKNFKDKLEEVVKEATVLGDSKS